jgi:hypothetical protein
LIGGCFSAVLLNIEQELATLGQCRHAQYRPSLALGSPGFALMADDATGDQCLERPDLAELAAEAGHGRILLDLRTLAIL